MTKQVHPFPARMAPELALRSLEGLPDGSLVIDPMAGSGTVLRHATALGHKAQGFDMDPLAVLMSRVSTTAVDDGALEEIARKVITSARSKDPSALELPWIDGDAETTKFVEFWFGEAQRNALRQLAHTLHELRDEDQAVLDVLRIAMSRIIVTKEQMASLARDTSHSRPHKVAESSDFDVFKGFERSVGVVRRHLRTFPPSTGAEVSLGDARNLVAVPDGSADMVLTSPPYLNAIDYMRGHRMALVWLGHRFSELRLVRASSIGAERKSDAQDTPEWVNDLVSAIGKIEVLPNRYQAMIERYVRDLRALMNEVSRILSQSGKATFVMGNSCLKGVFVRNSDALVEAGRQAGLKLIEEYERPLPDRNRYLPLTPGSALGARMRTETILTFAQA